MHRCWDVEITPSQVCVGLVEFGRTGPALLDYAIQHRTQEDPGDQVRRIAGEIYLPVQREDLARGLSEDSRLPLLPAGYQWTFQVKPSCVVMRLEHWGRTETAWAITVRGGRLPRLARTRRWARRRAREEVARRSLHRHRSGM